jgi:DNA-binding CsgD family transcriptional regulator
MEPVKWQFAARVIDNIGSISFGGELDKQLSAVTTFDMSCIFAFRYDNEPYLIYDGYSTTVSRKALKTYIKGAYLLDPYYVACVGNHPEGLWRMSELAPDLFFSSEFNISRDVHPCISSEAGSLVEEIGFIIPLESSISATYSLMRMRGTVAFSASEMKRLKELEPIVGSMVRAHWRATRPMSFVPKPVAQDGTESTFLSAFGETLTPAQRSVAKLILRGHSNASIASNLDITEGTAKLHRSNIYRRLSISSNAELFQLFITYLAR